MPTLGIACLQAYLKKQGYTDTNVWDANLDFFHHLFQKTYFEGHLLEAKQRNLLDETQQAVLEAMRFNFQDRMETFHQPALYYDAEKNNNAFRCISNGLELYNLFENDLRFSASPSSFSVQFKSKPRTLTLGHVLSHVEHGHAYHFDRFFQAYEHKIEAYLESDVVAFSCANPDQLLGSLRMAKYLKEREFPGKIIMGGSFVTRARKNLSNNPSLFKYVDCLAVYEGEETLVEFLQYIENKKAISDVPNLIYLQEERVVSTKIRKIQNIFHLPTPDFSHYELHRYLTPEPVMPIYASRGCYYDVCSFCNHHENYFGGYRVKKASDVLESMKTYQTLYGCTKFFFVDEISAPTYQLELAQLAKEGNHTFRWYVHCRVDPSFTTKDLKTMAEGGVTLLHAGVESSSTNVLELMKKGYARQDVLDFLSKLALVPMTAHLNTIQGFPGEDPQDYIQTLEDMYAYAKVGDIVHLYSFSLLQDAPLQIKGNPFIKSQSHADDDLLEYCAFELHNPIEPTEEQKKRISYLQTVLLKKMVFMSSLFPQDTNWATHLLYVSYFRQHGFGDVIDQQLKEFKASEYELFATDEWMHTKFELLPTLEVLEQEALDPVSLLHYQFDREFLQWLKVNVGVSFQPDELQVSGLEKQALKENLYKLYRMHGVAKC